MRIPDKLLYVCFDMLLVLMIRTAELYVEIGSKAVFDCRKRSADGECEKARSSYTGIIAWCALACVCLAPVRAQASPDDPPDQPVQERDSGRRLLLFPSGSLYKPYIADPHRVGFGLVMHQYIDPDIPDSGSQRATLKAGGRLGLVGWLPKDPSSGARWQLTLEAGLDAQFDVGFSLDSIGWDGNYGPQLTAIWPSGLSLKTGMLHTSSHVGDEYAERTGRLRIGYTREEIILGLSHTFKRRWRPYAEGGWAYKNSSDVQAPGRLQAGLEYEVPESLWQKRLGWYWAVDLSAMEERAWSLDVSAQLGVLIVSPGRSWRIGLEYHDGRPALGEFYQRDENYVALGLWLDV